MIDYTITLNINGEEILMKEVETTHSNYDVAFVRFNASFVQKVDIEVVSEEKLPVFIL